MLTWQQSSVQSMQFSDTANEAMLNKVPYKKNADPAVNNAILT
jgi:hypothetical protein